MRDAIPDEIMEEARDIIGDYLDLNDDRNAQLSRVVAAGLMARDMRAAKIVGGIGSVLNDHDAKDAGDMLSAIATAILTYGDDNGSE